MGMTPSSLTIEEQHMIRPTLETTMAFCFAYIVAGS